MGLRVSKLLRSHSSNIIIYNIASEKFDYFRLTKFINFQQKTVSVVAWGEAAPKRYMSLPVGRALINYLHLLAASIMAPHLIYRLAIFVTSTGYYK